MQALEAAVRSLVASSGVSRVAVVAGVIGTPRALEIHADDAFHAASTIKIAVLLDLYRRAWAGELSLEERLAVRNAFVSVADGSPYALDPADDTETALYGRLGEAVTLRELAHLMITVSSNLATNLLVDRLGAPAVDATVRSLEVSGVRVLRGVEDGPAFAAGLNNTVTATGLADILELIATGRAAAPEACEAMLEVLAAQQLNEGIPAGLPPGTRVAHKTGSITSLYHDAAVVYPPDAPPYVLVVLTAGLDEVTAGPWLVRRIATLVHARLAGADAP